MSKMLFNATNLKSEGGVSLLFHFIESFLEYDPELEIVLYLNPILEARINKKFEGTAHFSVVPFKAEGNLKRFFWEQVTLPKIIKRDQFDSLFSFGNTGPLFPGCRQILYMHQPVPYTDFKPNSHRLAWEKFAQLFKFLVVLTQLGSDKIVVQTRWLIEPLRRSVFNFIPKERYIVSKPGIPEKNLEEATLTDTEEKLIAQLITEKEAGTKLLFYPSFLSPYKNIPYLLTAIHHLKSMTERPFKLILTFNRDSNEYFPCKDEIFETIDRLELNESKELCLTDSLGRLAVSKIYEMTDILCFPSLAETLGMPQLEAMSLSIPIVAVDVDYARDVCGDGAQYADKNKPTQFAEHLANIINNPDEARNWQQKSHEQLPRFNWENNAKNILE